MSDVFNINDFLNSISDVNMKEVVKKFDQSVMPYASVLGFPVTGDENTLYIDTTSNTLYRWDDTDIKYYQIAGGSGSGDFSSIKIIDGSF
jgi:hypothetical protein